MKRFLALPISLLFFQFCSAQSLDNLGDRSGGVFGYDFSAGSLVTEMMLTAGEAMINEYRNDKRFYSAGTKGRKLHGAWKSWYENGLLCDSGTFNKGLPDGVWKFWNNSGELMAVRTFSAEKFRRISHEMVRYHPRRISFTIASLYQRNKRAALKYMQASYSFESAAGKKAGITLQELIASNITEGNPYLPVFDYGLHHGEYVNYFAGGIAKDSGYYKNGLRQGEWIHRDSPDGLVTKGAYEDGKKTKNWRTYDPSGRLTSIVHYNRRGDIGWTKTFQ